MCPISSLGSRLSIRECNFFIICRAVRKSVKSDQRNICLFTAHSPEVGGGGAILRSLLPDLREDVGVMWCYLAARPVLGHEKGWLGEPLMGHGGAVADLSATTAMLCGVPTARWERLLRQLVDIDCDAYWIVSHNEGLCVARDLARASSRPVHLTVHDDWAGALCARSVRYRLLAPLADNVTRHVLKRVSSVDVVSCGMREYYRRSAGVEAVICHRYLPQLPPPASQPDGPLIVGHIGSIYSAKELWCFAEAFKRFCVERGEKGRIRFWGCHLSNRDVPRHLEQWVEFCPNAAEEQVVLQLQQCHFVYAMYPFARRLRKFSQTSLPTKLSTYVLAQRPILGHGPADSSLAQVLQQTGLGCLWENRDVAAGERMIASLLGTPVAPAAWERARAAYFGRPKVETLRSALSSLVPWDTRGSNVADRDS